MEIAEDPMAGPDDRCALSVDQDAKRVAVAGEDSIDDRAVISTLVRALGRIGTGDGSSPNGMDSRSRPNL